MYKGPCQQVPYFSHPCCTVDWCPLPLSYLLPRGSRMCLDTRGGCWELMYCHYRWEVSTKWWELPFIQHRNESSAVHDGGVPPTATLPAKIISESCSIGENWRTKLVQAGSKPENWKHVATFPKLLYDLFKQCRGERPAELLSTEFNFNS
jgi:hypothetical protein